MLYHVFVYLDEFFINFDFVYMKALKEGYYY